MPPIIILNTIIFTHRCGGYIMKHFFEKITRYMTSRKSQSSRKEFLRGIAVSLSSIPLVKALSVPALAESEKKLKPRQKRITQTMCDLAVVKGNRPAAITRKAIQALGGMSPFVKKGDIVVIKP